MFHWSRGNAILSKAFKTDHQTKANQIESKYNRFISCISVKFEFWLLRTALLLCKKYSTTLFVSMYLANPCC